MTTWEDFEADVTTVRPHRGVCGVRMLLDSLTSEARDKVSAALDNQQLSNSSIATALRKRLGEHAPRAYTVGRHRRGDCSCP